MSSNFFGVVLRLHAVLHDLFMSRGCAQHCFPVLCLIDAFVHIISIVTTGTTLGMLRIECMQERIRRMTALTAAYAHAFQGLCIGRRAGGCFIHSFRLVASNAYSLAG